MFPLRKITEKNTETFNDTHIPMTSTYCALSVVPQTSETTCNFEGLQPWKADTSSYAYLPIFMIWELNHPLNAVCFLLRFFCQVIGQNVRTITLWKSWNNKLQQVFSKTGNGGKIAVKHLTHDIFR